MFFTVKLPIKTRLNLRAGVADPAPTSAIYKFFDYIF